LSLFRELPSFLGKAGAKLVNLCLIPCAAKLQPSSFFVYRQVFNYSLYSYREPALPESIINLFRFLHAGPEMYVVTGRLMGVVIDM
jgi:hypothetical protein